MRTLEQDTRDRTRTVSGYINSTGSVNYGSGFSVVKIGTGSYAIHFTPGFRTLPIVTCLMVGTIGPILMSYGQNDAVNIGTYNTSGGLVDAQFMFVARGLV